jgi:hypothetical protein
VRREAPRHERGARLVAFAEAARQRTSTEMRSGPEGNCVSVNERTW